MTRKVDIGEPPVPVNEPPEQFPPLMAPRLGGRAPAGLLIQAAACLVLIVVFKLDAIASIGSPVALLIFMLVTAAHFRVRARVRPDRAAARS
jgi:hypothetical protein